MPSPRAVLKFVCAVPVSVTVVSAARANDVLTETPFSKVNSPALLNRARTTCVPLGQVAKEIPLVWMAERTRS